MHSQLASPLRRRAVRPRDRAERRLRARRSRRSRRPRARGTAFAQNRRLHRPDRGLPALACRSRRCSPTSPRPRARSCPNLDGQRAAAIDQVDAFESGAVQPRARDRGHDARRVLALRVYEHRGRFRQLHLAAAALPVRGDDRSSSRSAYPRRRRRCSPQYPCTTATSAARDVIAIGTDALFACPARRAARRCRSSCRPTSTSSTTPMRRSRSYRRRASTTGPTTRRVASLFDSTTLGGHAPFTPDQEALAAAMVRYWTQFAAQGDPNGAQTPQWPAYTAGTDSSSRSCRRRPRR